MLKRNLGPCLQDPERLQALRQTGLVQAGTEDAFDRYTRLAARVLSLPVCGLWLAERATVIPKSLFGVPPGSPFSPAISGRVSVTQCLVVDRTPLLMGELVDCCELVSTGMRSIAGVPIVISSGHALGALCVMDSVPHVWTDHELEVLSAIAVAVVSEIERRLVDLELRQRLLELEHRERLLSHQQAALDRAGEVRSQLGMALQRERAVVRKLARSFLGRIPRLTGYRIATVYRPAFEAARIGGDYYDFIRLGTDRLGIVIGDVCGKGLSAAVYTSMTVCMLRYYAREHRDPRRVIELVNAALYTEMNPESMFVTLFLGILDVCHGTLDYVNAGHPAPILYDPASGALESLPVTGGVVGVIQDMPYEQGHVEFPRGRLLVLFTDGVTEAGKLSTADDGDVPNILKGLPESDLNEPMAVVKAIYRECQRKAAGKLHDDLAIVVVKRD